MTILIPTDNYEALVDAAERWRNVNEDLPPYMTDPEPEPIVEHYFEPYNYWEGNASICANGCGASRVNPVHFV